MKLLNKFFLVCFLLVAFVACRKNENLDLPQPVGLGGDTWASGPIDKWLNDSLTAPYNIAVKYRWDPWELHLDRTLTPPDESKIIPAMSAIKRVWIDPYNAETGSELFIKKYAPKQFVLVGSVEYNPNGTVLLGQAEGGNNISFFDINQNFDKNNISSIRRMIQTSHHEFGHILHQNVRYPEEFKFITSGLGLPGYTGTWFNVSPQQALEWGYITPYSMATHDEDFVEMIANMLMEGKTRFEEIIASTNPVAQQSLRAKQEIVVTYFRQVWNIDFNSLQTRVQAALNSLVPTPAVIDAYGFGKTYTTASVDPANQTLLPQRPSFMAIYNTSKDSVAAIPGFGLSMDSMALINSDANTAILRLYISQNGNIFFADFAHTQTRDVNNVYSYVYQGTNGNGDIIKDAVTPLLNYFANNRFTISWYADPGVSIFPRVKFTPQAIPGTYFLALLLP